MYMCQHLYMSMPASTPTTSTTVSVSELARNVAALVRRAEDGEEIIITRDGRSVAELRPRTRPNGAALIELFEEHGPDPEWADLIEQGRTAIWSDR